LPGDVEKLRPAPTYRCQAPNRCRDDEETDVKYLLLIYGNEELWNSFGPEDLEPVIKETEALQKELRVTGEFIGAYGVADQSQAKTVHIQDGVPVVTDGPYLEAKEYLGSIDIIECASLERALEIAGRVPFARLGKVELRPLEHESQSN
jgi:hypothetical protein